MVRVRDDPKGEKSSQHDAGLRSRKKRPDSRRLKAPIRRFADRELVRRDPVQLREN